MDRRDVLKGLLSASVAPPTLLACGHAGGEEPSAGAHSSKRRSAGEVTLFLAGDVMTGRGIDQILAHPGDPTLYEGYVESAIEYVELAEQASGPIPRQVAPPYIWGDALVELARVAPAARIVNLETAVTDRGRPEPKGINYRMHPRNVAHLAAAQLDGCVLANNHVLDWGSAGLAQTLEVLHEAGIRTAGAGADLDAALGPAELRIPGAADERRVLVFGLATASSGVPARWAAGEAQPGVALLPDLSDGSADALAARVRQLKRSGDLVIASLHWGDNWGYEVSAAQRRFARRLIDGAGVDIVHGHSSHHPRGIEVYAGRLILYGCGDLVNDYEGIAGHEEYRGDLSLMYFPVLDSEGALAHLRMIALQIRRFQLRRASEADTRWLRDAVTAASATFGTSVDVAADGRLSLEWG